MPTPDPEPVHTGVRPLSPHGEGYCRWCFFVVGLDEKGNLVYHDRGSVSAYDSTRSPCDGWKTRPPKVTPYASRKAAFRTSSPDAWCPDCKKYTGTTRHGGMQVYARHLAHPSAPKWCSRTLKPVDPDHRR